MQEHITPYRIANSMMQDTTFDGVYLIVEGKSDYFFFKKFISKEKSRIEQAFGSQNVIEVVKILSEREFERKLAILDSDFRRLDGEIPNSQDILLVDDHDVEVMIFKSPALFRVLEQHYSEDKYKSFLLKKNSTFREVIMDLATPIGYLKWANNGDNLGLVFKPKDIDGRPIKYHKFIDEKEMRFKGHDILLQTVLDYSHQKSPGLKSKEKIQRSYESQITNTADLFQLCNGHDLVNLISLALRKAIGNRNVDPKIIESELILSFDSSEFKETELFSQLKQWQKEKGREVLSTIFD